MLSEQLKFDIEHMNLEGLAALREQKCQALEIADIKRKNNDFQLEAMKKRIEIYTEKLKELEVAAERKKIRCDELEEQIAYISEKIAKY